MPISSSPDHVAVAVPSIPEAAMRWCDGFGGAWCSPKHSDGSGFATQQLWYRGGAKLELLEPETDDGFAAGFLKRFGARVHHVTLKVPDLSTAVEVVRDAGYDVVDINTDLDEWHEGFLRPSQVGGVIVQLARSELSVEDWAKMLGFTPEPLPIIGPALHGPTLYHPDLDACARVWTVLGGTVERDDEVVRVSWPDSPLTVHVERREDIDPPVLRFTDGPRASADPRLGPATVTDRLG